MKPLDDMTEPELRQLTNAVCNAVKQRLPKDVCFAVIFWPFGEPGIGQCGANAERSGMIQALRETADRLEKNQDVKR